ncbi:MAG: TetR/AcrR family transcriptional regulator [Henriciella sp.]|nr:TetR/AcrR family transcriptional regulator [Henriciella sp.]
MSELSGKFPKREKKKAETRKKIILASLDLFFERDSSDDVTLEEVAERAGIHVQTLYRHFPNKVSLMLAGDQHYLDQFEAFIKDPIREGDTFSIWREWLKFAYREFLEDESKYKGLYLRKFESMSGVAGLWKIQNAYEDILCASLARDFGMSAEGMGLPRLVAGMLTAGNAAVVRRFTEQEIDFMGETLETVAMVKSLFSHLIVDQAKSA